MDLTFDRIPGLIDLLARMERFTVDSPGREYLVISRNMETIRRSIAEVVLSDSDPLPVHACCAMVERIYDTPAYRSYRDVCKQLFERPFFDGVEYVKRLRREELAREKDRWETEQRCRGLANPPPGKFISGYIDPCSWYR